MKEAQVSKLLIGGGCLLMGIINIRLYRKIIFFCLSHYGVYSIYKLSELYYNS